jgi:hypothetical protein
MRIGRVVLGSDSEWHTLRQGRCKGECRSYSYSIRPIAADARKIEGSGNNELNRTELCAYVYIYIYIYIQGVLCIYTGWISQLEEKDKKAKRGKSKLDDLPLGMFG